MQATDPQPRSAAPFRELLADLVLWLTLVVLFLAFRVVLFLIFRSEMSEQPSSQAFFRCFETGLKSDTTAATWALLPSLALTLVGFFQPLGIWHRRLRRVTTIVVLALCAIIFVSDVGYFAEYDNQFDHWIFGLIYDDRRAILATIWKSHHVVLLIILGSLGAIVGAWLLNKLLHKAESADVPNSLGTRTARVITVIVIAIWVFVGAKVWLGRNFAGLKNAASTGDVFL